MTTQNVQARLVFAGGWATDFGPTAQVSIGEGGLIQIPYLLNAENCVYDLDGGPKKIPGTSRVYETALNENGTTIRGLTDFWKVGTGADIDQYRVLMVGDKIMADKNSNATFTSISDSIAARDTGSTPSFAIFEDELIIMTDKGEAPLKWTATAGVATDVETFGTNTPMGAFGITHKNRFWMAGVRTKKSRLFYSEPLTAAGGGGINGDWEGVEAGFIDIDPDDGDQITGLASYKKEIWIFKGPYVGSIHRVSGDTPVAGVTVFGASTSPTPFSLNNFVRGLGAAGHNSIFRFKDDIGFIDAKTASVHSLKATAAFGDFLEGALSLPINEKYLLSRVNKAILNKAVAATDVANSTVLITLAIDANATNNIVLAMDYRFDPPRWSNEPAVIAQSMGVMIDQTDNNKGRVFLGGTDGFLRKMGVANRSIDATTAITYKVTLPHINFGNPAMMKTQNRIGVGIEPRGNYNATFGWTRDGKAQQTQTFSQGGADVLAGTVTKGVYASIAASGSSIEVTSVSSHGRSVGDVVSLRGISAAIASIAQNGTDITVTPSAAHSLEVGDEVTLLQTTDYDGVYTVTAISGTTTFDVTATFTSDRTGVYAESNYNARYTISAEDGSTKFTVPATFVTTQAGFWETASQAQFFVLGSSQLGGSRFSDRFFSTEEGGEFRSASYEITQGGLDEDIAVHSIFTEISVDADSGEN